MRITLNAVSKPPALDAVSLAYGTGEAVLARAETEQRPSVLGLLASGRMKPGTGSVTIDGKADSGLIRRSIALVDAPDVCDPAPNVTVAGVTSEELMFAGKPSGPLATKRMLASLGFEAQARDAIGQVSPTVRIRLLVELALLRDGVQGIVITAPDRHGGDPNLWWRIALDVASRGYAVLVIAGDASAAAIAASSLVERLDAPWDDPTPGDDPGRDDSDVSFLDLPDVITRPVPVISSRDQQGQAGADVIDDDYSDAIDADATRDTPSAQSTQSTSAESSDR